MGAAAAGLRAPRLLSQRARRSMCGWAVAGPRPACAGAEAAADIRGYFEPAPRSSWQVVAVVRRAIPSRAEPQPVAPAVERASTAARKAPRPTVIAAVMAARPEAAAPTTPRRARRWPAEMAVADRMRRIRPQPVESVAAVTGLAEMRRPIMPAAVAAGAGIR